MKTVFPIIPHVLLVTALALASCASTPTPVSEFSAAQQSIARAEGDGADQYAEEELARARSLLTQAQAAMDSGQNEHARQLAWRAATSADLATARSRNAAALATLEKHRNEVATLRNRLQQEPLP